MQVSAGLCIPCFHVVDGDVGVMIKNGGDNNGGYHINNAIALLKVTRTLPYVCGKVLEQSYTHTTSCFPSLSLMNLQMQGLMILR